MIPIGLEWLFRHQEQLNQLSGFTNSHPASPFMAPLDNSLDIPW
jgi:hypothetical protein